MLRKSWFSSLTVILILSVSVLAGVFVTSDAHAFDVEDKVVVQNTFIGLNVRSNHSVNAKWLDTLNDGTRGTVLDGPEEEDNYTWYKVKWDTPDELEGWSISFGDGCAVLGTVEDAEKRDAIVVKLFGFDRDDSEVDPDDVDALTLHEYNGYACNLNWREHGELVYKKGGHGGWDVQTQAHYDPERDDFFYALTDGQLIADGEDKYNTIAVYDGKNTTLYLHAREVFVSMENPTIKRGMRLGKQGNVGLGESDDKTRSHVHIEVLIKDNPTPSAGAGDPDNPSDDPIPYLFEWVTKEDSEEDELEKTLKIISVVHTSDVNGDDSVNIIDLLLVWLHIGEDAEDFPQYDVNRDGTIDNDDLSVVIDNLGATSDNFDAAAPSTTANLADVPRENALLPNYPNPFNPETWIPYQLANASNVQIIIYNTRGTVVRQLDLGHQREGYYTGRSRAAYWDGTNDVGESVSSGIYFYQLRANDVISPLRKMVILK